jgi:hypothetical protein
LKIAVAYLELHMATGAAISKRTYFDFEDQGFQPGIAFHDIKRELQGFWVHSG